MAAGMLYGTDAVGVRWLCAAAGMLYGTDAAVVISHVEGNPEDPVWSAATKGSEGDQAGAAYLYVRDGEQWTEVGCPSPPCPASKRGGVSELLEYDPPPSFLHSCSPRLSPGQVAKIRGSDTDEVDQFGTSVAIAGDPSGDMFVAVGAPGADDPGVYEVQRIHCSTSPPACVCLPAVMRARLCANVWGVRTGRHGPHSTPLPSFWRR
jgi:hypothetical protein